MCLNLQNKLKSQVQSYKTSFPSIPIYLYIYIITSNFFNSLVFKCVCIQLPNFRSKIRESNLKSATVSVQLGQIT